jgi:hypothetical protein
MTFTLWWCDDAGRGRINTRLSSQDTKLNDALRVIVQFQSYRDHATITFYVDGAKTFLGQQLHAQTDRALTSRQASFFKHLTTIRRTAHNEIHSGAIDLPAAQMHARDASETIALTEAADYLYRSFWEEFEEGNSSTVLSLLINEG